MKIAIIGAGGFARELASYIDGETLFFVDDRPRDPEKNIYHISEIKIEEFEVLVAIGDSKTRSEIVARLPDGIKFHTFIHKSAYVGSDVKLGEGSIVCPGAVLTTNITTGKHAQIHASSVVGHDTSLGDFVTVSPGACVSGANMISSRVYLGTNSTTKQGVSICSDVVVGLNAGVVKDILKAGVYVATPARKINE